MNTPEELLYSKTHEWVKVEEGVATVGITDFAQDELGEVVYLELPEVGDTVGPDTPFGVIESIKAVSDLIAGITGTVVEVNTLLHEEPERINEDPYGEGWMLKVRLADAGETQLLMSAAQYRQMLEEA
ncbi:MAG: glycine cleavage system protein H [Armatimonadetes bacterium CG_4_10_14_3_um_filter_66_18]|nr:glycine cleavage system protein GcvH [Armatimonadota bacterium]OIO96219.1 MAG: glycine cleavage system protein H [Armatimonadetes bacterium CG2_30_66_41]PIU94396.1 MAG: glycine cleavage system protein H [Armatimonadetes bacterium CG06_land_8_20_14_3_00_66_21]PIX46326.1 MAG: glycine cleavage system protein H [Armatimonadetes bacterium CG_4_8_14_3_um_filter_66_20]PIY37279.1 MAG: glycine cleavage system protein H [Armatimonadetes bacterium CG_4_10_14_3_um_filter_66_18]PIZ33206.1 MAG: glycine c